MDSYRVHNDRIPNIWWSLFDFCKWVPLFSNTKKQAILKDLLHIFSFSSKRVMLPFVKCRGENWVSEWLSHFPSMVHGLKFSSNSFDCFQLYPSQLPSPTEWAMFSGSEMFLLGFCSHVMLVAKQNQRRALQVWPVTASGLYDLTVGQPHLPCQWNMDLIFNRGSQQ